MSESLTCTETLALEDCEHIIERGMTTFVEVGAAVAKIREGRLYRATHATFEEYCRERWGWSRQRAHQLITASEVVGELASTTVDAPTTERQARELVVVPKDERPQVMATATERAKAAGRKVTAKDIREARAPEPEVEHQADEPDPLEEWGRCQREVERLTKLVASLEASDAARELVAASAHIAGLEGRLAQAIVTKNEAERTAKTAVGWLAKIRKELGVEANSQIIDAIRDMKR